MSPPHLCMWPSEDGTLAGLGKPPQRAGGGPGGGAWAGCGAVPGTNRTPRTLACWLRCEATPCAVTLTGGTNAGFPQRTGPTGPAGTGRGAAAPSGPLPGPQAGSDGAVGSRMGHNARVSDEDSQSAA